MIEKRNISRAAFAAGSVLALALATGNSAAQNPTQTLGASANPTSAPPSFTAQFGGGQSIIFGDVQINEGLGESDICQVAVHPNATPDIFSNNNCEFGTDNQAPGTVEIQQSSGDYYLTFATSDEFTAGDIVTPVTSGGNWSEPSNDSFVSQGNGVSFAFLFNTTPHSGSATLTKTGSYIEGSGNGNFRYGGVYRIAGDYDIEDHGALNTTIYARLTADPIS